MDSRIRYVSMPGMVPANMMIDVGMWVNSHSIVEEAQAASEAHISPVQSKLRGGILIHTYETPALPLKRSRAARHGIIIDGTLHIRGMCPSRHDAHDRPRARARAHAFWVL